MDILKKRFYKRFSFIGVLYFFTFIALTVIACIQWVNCRERKNLVLAIIFTVCSIVIVIQALKELLPYFKDLKYVKKSEFSILIGEVEGYKTINYNSDPPTTEKFPIVKDISNSTTIMLNVDNAKKGIKYKFLYLPNTKLAIIAEEKHNQYGTCKHIGVKGKGGEGQYLKKQYAAVQLLLIGHHTVLPV